MPVRLRPLLPLLLLAACGQGAPPSADPALEASVLQYRRDAALAQLQVRLVPTAGATVDAVRLLAERFPASPRVPEDSRLAAGRAVALPVPHGAPDCGVPAGAPVAVELVLDGQRVVRPVDPEALDRVADRLCAAEALARQVRLAVELTAVAGQEARADLVLERGASSEELAVTGLGGNVLLAVEPAAPLPVLAPGAATARLPLRLRAARCDPHALAESKQTSVFRVFVRVGAGEPQQALVRTGASDARDLERWVVAACR